ncbi:hypothetical protein QWY31_16185 [Cytophagales bacterium LB-30]|uniref:Uncharacterized protein n=1 Tax=Shiella aurantiaca TaxID=3058365 RepID=A0ABT8FA33_9BACT|nr:hypothetical protein [Shiella aurantiaca]MDN4167051.1 hypothetical protein [Shiella aurantiaca]
MKNKLMVFTMAGALAIAGLAYGINSSQNACPLEGTPECPKVNCPLDGTPDCPYDLNVAEVPACCKKK